MIKLIALVDCSAFYCSCERIFRPDLRNTPICVLSNNDGCIVARDQKVKDLGIKMGLPYFKIKKELAKNGVKVFSSNYSLYADISKRVMTVLKSFTDDFEQYSIDEAYLGIETPGKNIKEERERLDEWGSKIRKTVYKHTGIPVRVSVAETKTLAKLGSEYAKLLIKKGQEPVVCFWNHEDKTNYMNSTTVDKIWGIGRRKALKLKNGGIETINQFISLPDNFIKKEYTMPTLKTAYELRGIKCIDIETVKESRKTIVRSRMLKEKTSDFEILKKAILLRTYKAVQKLRSENLLSKRISVFIQTSRYAENRAYLLDEFTLSVPSNDYKIFKDLALKLLNRIHLKGYDYSKAGIIMSEIQSATEFQDSLFNQEEKPQISNIIDICRSKFGERKVQLGILGLKNNENKVEIKREMLSPEYTTKLSDVMKVN